MFNIRFRLKFLIKIRSPVVMVFLLTRNTESTFKTYFARRCIRIYLVFNCEESATAEPTNPFTPMGGGRGVERERERNR